jgi:hypothetical protein
MRVFTQVSITPSNVRLQYKINEPKLSADLMIDRQTFVAQIESGIWAEV